ncbi:MAG: replication-relaxation family protein [Thermomicrobiales bacterium]|nr:replication-relaxation family protein [Thermomicrobiales bacterium]
MRHGSASFVWCLDVFGDRLTREEHQARRRYHEPSVAFLAHTLAVTDIHIQLAEAARAGAFHLTAVQVETEAWRHTWPQAVPSALLKPDLMVTVSSDAYDDHWYLEVDLGTESLPVLLRKCTAYEEYRRTGRPQSEHGVFLASSCSSHTGPRGAVVGRHLGCRLNSRPTLHLHHHRRVASDHPQPTVTSCPLPVVYSATAHPRLHWPNERQWKDQVRLHLIRKETLCQPRTRSHKHSPRRTVADLSRASGEPARLEQAKVPATPRAPGTGEAVLYLRVSTQRQLRTATDIDPDGNSIATQREATIKRAKRLNAPIAQEFVEPGHSAQSIAKRPVFRNCSTTLRNIRKSATSSSICVRGCSATRPMQPSPAHPGQHGRQADLRQEEFGEGYMADAMEAITDIMNEVQVRQSGEDISNKMLHKAKNRARLDAPNSDSSTSARRSTDLFA